MWQQFSKFIGGKPLESPRKTQAQHPVSSSSRRPVIGLALGGGAARGWSHIGVIQELAGHGIHPDVIAGTSIGAVVGGCMAAGRLEELEGFARSLTRHGMFSWMDLSFSGGGLLRGGYLKTRLEKDLGAMMIEDLAIRFAAVATEVGTGNEIWLTQGHLSHAIRASYALPGIFEPVRLKDRWLFDGALVNPVPVSVCRSLGADYVIAVNLLADPVGRSGVITNHNAIEMPALPSKGGDAAPSEGIAGFLSEISSRSGLFGSGKIARMKNAPTITGVIIDAFNITQDRIARSRLAGDPPDITITPRGGKVGLFDFHRADELITMGREAVKRALPDILSHTDAVKQA